jgi:phosphoribosylglycinamide formyltransferase-1
MGKHCPNIAVAVSGSGRTLENLVGSNLHGKSYRVSLVIASSKDCKAFGISRNLGIPVLVANFRTMAKAGDGSSWMFRFLGEKEISLVVLAGFLKPFPCQADWVGRIVNIHPALLPEFGGHGMYGMRVHEAVLKSGRRESGATVHFVTDEYDRGEIIARTLVPILSNDSADLIAERVFAAECKIYPTVIADLLAGKLPQVSGEPKTY